MQRANEHDLEPLRFFFLGNDSYAWRLLVTYLMMVDENPNEPFNMQFLPLCFLLIVLSSLALLCSLTHLLAAYSLQLASTVQMIHQVITSLSTGKAEGQKGLWTNYHFEDQLNLLLQADYSLFPVSVNEASIQCDSNDPSDVLRDERLLELLSNDHANGTKLRVPFLSTVSIGCCFPFSRKQYTYLLKRLQENENSVVFPNLFNLLPSHGEKCSITMLDYWLLEGDQKQCSLKSGDVIGTVVIERLPRVKENDSEAGFSLSLSIPLTKLSNKRKKMYTGKYCLHEDEKTETTQRYSCVVVKSVVTMKEPACVFIDGVAFSDVTFMTISNRYFSRTKSFPLSLPFKSYYLC